MFLYLHNCDAEYTLKSGEVICAVTGNLVYIPINSEYLVKFYNHHNEDSSTVGINFYLFDENNQPFVMSDKITAFKHSECRFIVERINDACESPVPCYGKMKAGVYEIISMLSEKHKIGKKYKIIEKGIKYLESDFAYEMSIGDIAKMCNVSEIYFRKLFKEYSGLPPADYRLKAKLEKAKMYLEYDNMTISQMAEILNFTNSAYFCRQFKVYTGMTPMDFRKRKALL
jgi:AraC-like DNA-binding protein